MGICQTKLLEGPSSKIELDKLRCSSCSLYLSCGPIKLTSIGTLCGRCTVPEGGTHEVLFEAILKDIIFPCRFLPYGCKRRLPFQTIAFHEDSCLFVPLRCPLKQCEWHGSQQQVYQHFISKHLDHNVPSEFNIDINTDSSGSLSHCQQRTPFFLKYDYSKDTRNLTYELNYFSTDPVSAIYTIKLRNDRNIEVSTNLRTFQCLRFNPIHTNNRTINMGNYIGALDNPAVIQVLFTILVNHMYLRPERTVNFDTLESLRCNECHNYLSLPIFDSAIGHLCCECSKNASTSRPSQDLELQQRVVNAAFPCRWKKCSHVDTGDRIRKHELNCAYYAYSCPSTGCNASLIYKQLFIHLAVFHGLILFENRTSYKFLFDDTLIKGFVTVRNNEIIVIKHVSKNNVHTLSVRSPGGLCKFTAKVYFEHSHCNLKSKTYTVNSAVDLIVDQNKLPKCFRNNQKMKLVIEI